MVRFHLKICWETWIEYHEIPRVKAKEAICHNCTGPPKARAAKGMSESL